MDGPIVGSEALRQRKLTRYQLRTEFRAIYPDIYLARHVAPSLRMRSEAAWLWTRRRGVLAGLAAAALHGANWIDEDEPVELIWSNQHAPMGIVTRNQRLRDNEITCVAGLPVTTVARTAFDLSCRLPTGEAVARLDALMRATPFSVEDVLLVTKGHPRARGLRRLRKALALVDPGAASPKETWLRLLIVNAGLPTPETQIPVVMHYRTVALLDMGWERFKVAVEYDGDQHRTMRRQYVRDLRRLSALQDCGWIVIRVIVEDRPEAVIGKIREALHRRGYRDT
ncbi:endonuclease domain-containing protein [Mycobacterium intracellulare]|uniref:endonuclease domain-containing protein n=1 Tax=Mycobacterium intracellulare TaxID=1767 RepID=UPI0039774498